MPKVDPDSVAIVAGSRYPSPYDEPCRDRQNQALGSAAGLTQFGVNLLTLGPGAWSSQRHWHRREDEFVYVLEGSVLLVDDDGEVELGPGDCAGFPAGEENGHHFKNPGSVAARLLIIGSRDDRDSGEYPDIDMVFGAGRYSGNVVFRRKDGSEFSD